MKKGQVMKTRTGTVMGRCERCGTPRLWRHRCYPCRVWSYVARGDESACWPWTGNLNGHGYGVISNPGKRSRHSLAHRVVFRLTKGPVAAGLVVMHRCDNPRCCNPAHLELATQAANLADMRAKGRASRNRARGAENGQALLTEDKVREIRRRYRAGDVTQAQVAAQFGVTRAAVCDVVRGKSWRHVQ